MGVDLAPLLRQLDAEEKELIELAAETKLRKAELQMWRRRARVLQEALGAPATSAGALSQRLTTAERGNTMQAK